MVHNSSKLQLWSSNEGNFVVGVSTTQGAALKGHRVKGLRTTVYHTHTNSLLAFFFFICWPFNRCKLNFSKAADTEGKFTNSNSGKQRWEKKIREGSWGGGWQAAGVTQWKQCFKNWNRMAKEREEKQVKRFSGQLSQNMAKTSDLT